MNLDDYLVALEECPDDELTKKFGLWDNYPIFVNAPFEKIVSYFHDYDLEPYTDKNDRFILNYTSETRVQLANWVSSDCLALSYDLKYKNEPSLKEQQSRRYTMTVTLHSRNLREMATLIKDISDYFRKNEFSFCLPWSVVGSDRRSREYPSLIVCYNSNKD